MAAVSSPAHYRKLYSELLRFWGSLPEWDVYPGLIELEESEFYSEVDGLLRLIESTSTGKGLVTFFGKCQPIPDLGGPFEWEYGFDDYELRMNGRRLNAFYAESGEGGSRADITCLIIQSCQSGLNKTYSLNVYPDEDERGHGTFAVVSFHPRSVYLIDDTLLAPELGLAHELIHAAHHVAGSFHRKSHTRRRWQNDHRGLARTMFQGRTGRSTESVDELERDPDKLNSLDPEQRKAFERDKEDLFNLTILAKRMLDKHAPISKEGIGGVPNIGIYYQKLTDYEEAITVGNDVFRVWLSSRKKWETISNPVFAADLPPEFIYANEISNRMLGAAGRVRDPGLRMKRTIWAQAIKEQRAISHQICEMGIAIEMRVKPRRSYAPTLSWAKPTPAWKHEEGALPCSRLEIDDAVFQGQMDPIARLIGWLDRNGHQNGEFRRIAKDYYDDLVNWAAWAASRAGGTGAQEYDVPPRSCFGGEPTSDVSVDPALVSDFAKEQAGIAVADLESHPELANMVTFSNNRLYRTGLPLLIVPRGVARK
ncbi:hypothetical protein ACIQU6_44350 [Streptomyces sp. NPDC090442]|uniref:hypothetical protein n=1 Tax=Streptomyces sp. NPDC090442 TaxID=3365962 RepID=UPI00382C24A4